jgi:catecholate siderophore receptor
MPGSQLLRTGGSHAALSGVLAVLLGQGFAQSRGAVHGRVLDPAGAPISNARITATTERQTPAIGALSDSAGEFVLSLAPGIYTVKVAAAGFLEESQTAGVSENTTGSLKFVLQLAGIHETVTVRESADYRVPAVSSATKTLTFLREVPQSITIIPQAQIEDQMMMSIGDVVRYVPGITAIQGENNRDQLVIRGNSTSADFFLDGVRDDVQYYRDLYNVDRVEALKGPNAMIFGRGGGGGVVNRVTKEAGATRFGEITALAGSYANKRFTADFDQPLNNRVYLRLNAMYENSGSFRKFVTLERHGITPALTLTPDGQTKITVSYENFRDDRVADRGIPSFQGRPVDVDIATYYGDPNQSHAGARVNLGSAKVERSFGHLTIRNRTTAGNYDRGYQNYVPGALTADKTRVTLSAYNNATQRRNLFNQTDLTFAPQTGRIHHTLLAGIEVGRQLTDNFRNTGYFNNSAASILAPFSETVIDTPIIFRQSDTDPDNHVKARFLATYLQDQAELTRRVILVAGLRFDYFDLQYHNKRTNDSLGRIDRLVSPRAGLIFKPMTALSLYMNYSVAHLPSSGDQFSSLTTITQQVKPEKFESYELGAKWDLSGSLSLTAAAYRQDRTNTRSTDPNDPTRIVQTGSQRTNGFELGVNGAITNRWNIAGGYAYQDAFFPSATIAVRTGAIAAQAPHHAFSLWNNYRILMKWYMGLGILNRSDMFAAVDDTVVLPGYTRVDAATFYSLTERLRLQINAENLLGRKYYINADNNVNISPGFPRSVRMGLIARF